ncbi:hypothetical protein [Streptomyces monashensis]|uniref:Uncharacterized protein n=1 Tax=Streptomyces monashensis TaxID=1678012 RepID=A0A1S2QMY0_9ACTN|nr:hypothetical protein [Streptomyces monashensis]OIK07518.1 hypothetical protein BIV23_03150 [Streptomyces monashensis]
MTSVFAGHPGVPDRPTVPEAAALPLPRDVDAVDEVGGMQAWAGAGLPSVGPAGAGGIVA